MEPADHDHTLPWPWTAFSGELKYEFIAAEIAVEEALSLSLLLVMMCVTS